MNVKIGYKASAEQFGPAALLEFSVEAERRGLEIITVSDHFQPWRHSDGHARTLSRGSAPPRSRHGQRCSARASSHQLFGISRRSLLRHLERWAA